jgi:hypothetical protein
MHLVELGYVWFKGKKGMRKERLRKETLSIVWKHSKKGWKERIWWAPHKKSFHTKTCRKVEETHHFT